MCTIEVVRLILELRGSTQTIEEFLEFMVGQTVVVCGDQQLYHLVDIRRFLE